MKCKRLSAAILSLVMIISLLPTTALAAEKNNVWSTAYDEIRIYLDTKTEKDFDNLEGELLKQVRIISPKYWGDDTPCIQNLERTYWYALNSIRNVTAKDITRIDLVRKDWSGHNSKIQIPIGGNETYKVTISEGESANSSASTSPSGRPIL